MVVPHVAKEQCEFRKGLQSRSKHRRGATNVSASKVGPTQVLSGLVRRWLGSKRATDFRVVRMEHSIGLFRGRPI